MSGPRILSAAVQARSQLLFLIVESVRGGRSRKRKGGYPAKKRWQRQRERKRENGYILTAPTVEVVQALLVACSRTYTLDRTFDLKPVRTT